MIDPFEQLGDEHAHLERVLRALEYLGRCAHDGKPVEVADARCILEYLIEYGGAAHHEKEESLLSPVLVQGGFGWSDEPLVSVRRQHRQVVSLVRSLYYLTQQREAWSKEDARSFASLALEYVSFSRRHMQHENGLFELASKRVDAPSKELLARRFEAFDAEVAASPEHAAAEQRLAQVIDRYREFFPAA